MFDLQGEAIHNTVPFGSMICRAVRTALPANLLTRDKFAGVVYEKLRNPECLLLKTCHPAHF
jgi:hypothetical protein